jgi:hypothetical protein
MRIQVQSPARGQPVFSFCTQKSLVNLLLLQYLTVYDITTDETGDSPAGALLLLNRVCQAKR